MNKGNLLAQEEQIRNDRVYSPSAFASYLLHDILNPVFKAATKTIAATGKGVKAASRKSSQGRGSGTFSLRGLNDVLLKGGMRHGKSRS